MILRTHLRSTPLFYYGEKNYFPPSSSKHQAPFTRGVNEPPELESVDGSMRYWVGAEIVHWRSFFLRVTFTITPRSHTRGVCGYVLLSTEDSLLQGLQLTHLQFGFSSEPSKVTTFAKTTSENRPIFPGGGKSYHISAHNWAVWVPPFDSASKIG